MERIWLSSYPPGVPHRTDTSKYASLLDYFGEACGAFGPRELSRSMGTALSYAETDELSRHVAAWIQSLGLTPGAKIALMMPNLHQYPVLLMGIIRSGHVLTSVNPLYTGRELRHQLQDSGAELIFILENFCGTLAQVIEDTPVRRVVISQVGDLLGPVRGPVVSLLAKHVRKMVPRHGLRSGERYQVSSFASVLAGGRRLPYVRPTLAPDDLVFLQYTGGTTGVAKGVLITHRNVLSAALQASAWLAPALARVPAGEIPHTIVALPLYHIFAFIVLVLGMHSGQQFTLIANPRDIPAFIKVLQERRFHVFPGVNTLFQALLNHPAFSRLDFSGLVVTLAGGMAATPATAEHWRRVTGCPMAQGWGMSETLGAGTVNPLDAEFTGSVGLPMPNIDISIRGEDGRELGIGEPGELCVRGESVCQGYYGRDNAEFFTEDGYLKTGDVASVDERGYVFLYDRKKDMIIVSGFNVYPNEVEAVLSAHPGVGECAVVGVPDPLQGEAVKAFVVRAPQAGGEVSAEDLMAYCKEQLTGYKRPRHIEFLSELPKTAVGKIQRNELRDRGQPGRG